MVKKKNGEKKHNNYSTGFKRQVSRKIVMVGNGMLEAYTILKSEGDSNPQLCDHTALDKDR